MVSLRKTCIFRRRRKLLLLVAGYLYWRRKERRLRKFWAAPAELLRTRDKKGLCDSLVQDLDLPKDDKFRSFFQMPSTTFYEILNYIEESITKVCTNMRKPISAEERLAVTLQFLVSGERYGTIAARYGMSKTIVSKIVPETCNAIWATLQPIVMPSPTKKRWKAISEQFEKRCGFPNCVGAIGGRHISIRAPNKSGKLYSNFMNTFSIVLLAIVDAGCKFIVVDGVVGGQSSNGRILSSSRLGLLMQNGRLNLPDNKFLPGLTEAVPPVFLGNEAFPLKPNLLNPFCCSCLDDEKKRAFNNRHSAVTQMGETAFALLEARFKVLRGRLGVAPEHADAVVKACTVLHNFLCDKNLDLDGYKYTGHVNPPNLNSDLLGLQKVDLDDDDDALIVRDSYATYFSTTPTS